MELNQQRSGPAALLGPMVMGTAVWCALGTLAVTNASSATARVAAPAPLWLLPILVIAAALVPAWRRHPSNTLPALASVVPWLPVPFPAWALIFTGPLAWAPIGAVLLASVTGVSERPAAWLRSLTPRRGVIAALLATLAACGLTWWSVGFRLQGGDEAHYLMITQSLLRDGDLRIENNHDNQEYLPFHPAPLRPDFTVRGQDREIYSIHAPGTAALVLPAYALAGWRGAQWFVLLLSVVTGALIWWTAFRLTDDAIAAWFGWAAVVLSPTFLLHSFAVFPDAPAALITAAALWAALELSRGTIVSTGRLAAIGGALACLPWLHSRLAVLAGGLGLVLLWQLWRQRATRQTDWRLRAAALFAVPAVSAVAWFGFFYVVYGVADPRVPYAGADETRLGWILQGITGLFLDQEFGMAAYAPVLAAIVAGWFRCADRDDRRTLWALTAAVLVYLSAVTMFRMWWAGLPSAPARFLVAVAPLLAWPAALAWRSADSAGRALLRLLLAASVAVSTVLAATHGSIAWNYREAQALWLGWIAPIVNLPRAWPSYFWNGDASFVGHVILALIALSVVWLGIRVAGRSRHWDTTAWPTAAGWWLVAGLPLVAIAGWTWTGGPALNPARAQLAVLGRAGHFDQTWAIGPWSVSRKPIADLQMTVALPAPGKYREQVYVRQFHRVPPGRYRIRLTAGDAPTAATLIVGDRGAPLRTFALDELRTGVTLTLSAGASALTVGTVGGVTDLRGWSLALEPLDVWRGDFTASAARSYGGTDVFARETALYLEGDGFWVPGGATADVVMGHAADGAAEGAPMTIRNGPVPNTITLTSGDWQWTAALPPDAVRPIDLPVPASGPLRVSLTSSSGFRPSDDGASTDSRYLGFRVEPRAPSR